MAHYDVKVSLKNGHVIEFSEEGKSENDIKNDIRGEEGSFNKHGIFFRKEDVVSVEVSKQ